MIKNFNIFKPKELTLANGKKVLQPSSKTPIYIVLVIIVAIISIRVTGFNLYILKARGIQFFIILKAIFKPNINYLPRIWKPLFDTIKMSLLGSCMGAIFALPFAFLASSNIIKNKYIVFSIKFLFSLIRTIPTLVSALIATYVFGLGTLAGTVAIFLFTFSFIGKITYEQIETSDMGPFESYISMGFTKIMAFRYGIFPQIASNFISTSLYTFEGNVRYAAILGYVGAGGIGLIINENIGWREYDNVGMILCTLFVTVFVIENISSYFRKKLN